jgi:hypothetical protein
LIFGKKKPVAELRIKYTHKGKVRDLLTEDYRTYLRVLTSNKAWLYDTEGLEPLEFIDFDKIIELKSFGVFHKVNLGKTKVVTFNYFLPEEFTFENYQLFIQKQSGINKLIGKVRVIDKMGISKYYTINSAKDVMIKVNTQKNKNIKKNTKLQSQLQLNGSVIEVAFSK